jgi:hypothetical protein
MSPKKSSKKFRIPRGHLKIKPSFSLPDKKSYNRRREKIKTEKFLKSAV